MDKTGPSDLYRSLTEPEGWRERDKAREAAFIDAMPPAHTKVGDSPLCEQMQTIQARAAKLRPIDLQDAELDAADPYTRLFLLAEYWQRKATRARADRLTVRAATDGWRAVDAAGNNVGGGCSLDGWMRAVRWTERQHGIGVCAKCGLPPGCQDCRAAHDVGIGA